MDQITHEVRLAQWAEIIRNCQLRPEGQTTKEWVAENPFMTILCLFV